MYLAVFPKSIESAKSILGGSGQVGTMISAVEMDSALTERVGSDCDALYSTLNGTVLSKVINSKRYTHV